MTSPQPAPESASAYRRDIDGLRAVAILLVIAFHYFSFHGGFVGVDIFFVISGYLITGIILEQSSEGRFSLAEFYARRIRRIFPALMVVLLACILFGWYELLSDEFIKLGQQVAAGSAYVSNLLFWQESGYFDSAAETKPLLHLWSLGIEEQFYLVWPALILLAGRSSKAVGWMIVTTLLLSFAANVYEVRLYAATAFYLPITRFWELSIGGLFAWLARYPHYRSNTVFKSNISAWLGLALIVAAVQLINDSKPFPGWWALLPTLGAALLIHAGPDAWFNRKVLSARGMVFIGLISYSLYLWHWPLIAFTRQLYLHWPRAANIGLVLASVVLAWLTCTYIEAPIRRLSVSGNGARRIIIVGLALALAFTGVGLGIASSVITSRYGNIQSISFKEVPATANPVSSQAAPICVAGDGDKMPADTTVYEPCEKNLFPGRPVVYLIGDSHSLALRYGLRDYLEKQRINLQLYAVTDCMPFALKDRREACNIYNQFIINRIRQEKPAVVVVSAYHLVYQQKWLKDTRYGSDENYLDFLLRNTADISKDGATRVIIVGEIPTWENSLPWVLNTRFLRERLAVPERTSEGLVPESLAIDASMRQLPFASGVSYLSLKDLLCNSAGCLTSVGKTLPDDLIVFDYGHLTTNGAAWVADHSVGPAVMQQLNTAIKPAGFQGSPSHE